MDNEFANALKQRNLTPKSVSDLTGIPLPTVQKHFYGTRKIGAQSLAKYQAIGIPLSDLRPDLWPPEASGHEPYRQGGGHA